MHSIPVGTTLAESPRAERRWVTTLGAGTALAAVGFAGAMGLVHAPAWLHMIGWLVAGTGLGVVGLTAFRIYERSTVGSPPVDAYAVLTGLVADTGTGVWDYDLRNSTIKYSDGCASMLGYEPGEIESVLSAWGKIVHPDDIDRVRTALDDYLTGRSANYQQFVRLRAADGQWQAIVDTGYIAERDSEGRPTRALGMHLPAPTKTSVKRSVEPSDHVRTLVADLERSVTGLAGHANLMAWQHGGSDELERSTVRCQQMVARLRAAVEPPQDSPPPFSPRQLAESVATEAESTFPPSLLFRVDGDVQWGGTQISASWLRALLQMMVDDAGESCASGGGTVEIELGGAHALERVEVRAEPTAGVWPPPARAAALEEVVGSANASLDVPGAGKYALRLPDASP